MTPDETASEEKSSRSYWGFVLWPVVGVLVLLSYAVCHGQGTTHISFDQPNPQPPGTAYLTNKYDEAGMSFTPVYTTGFVRQGGGVAGFPENGSTYLQAGLGSTLKFSFTNGTTFALVSVDLAGYSDIVPDFSIPFVGYSVGGMTVTTNFSGSGINFKTVYFGQEFSGLTRVEIPGDAWSLDNVEVRIPEPSSVGILLLEGLLLGRLRLINRGSLH